MVDWSEHFREVAHRAAFGAEMLVAKRTILTPDEGYAAIAEGYHQVTRRGKPPKKILALLGGQAALETGNFQQMYDFEFGNAKRSGGDAYYQSYPCSEVENGVETHYPAGDSHCMFAAHKTAAEGAAHFIQTLQKRSHWWNGLLSGDPEKFIAGLTTAPVYFTADRNLYKKVLIERMSKYEALARKYSQNTILQVFSGLAVTGAAFAGYKYWETHRHV